MKMSSLVLVGTLLAAPVLAENSSLAPELAMFKPLLSTTWQGNLAQPGQAAKVDISQWERALNGQAIRITHSVERGAYGGETMLFWDKAQQSLVYYYFTTAGFYTHGTMIYDAKNQQFVAQEDVENNAQGITKVRSTTKLEMNQLTVTSEYFKDGKWLPGHHAVYVPVTNMQPEFR